MSCSNHMISSFAGTRGWISTIRFSSHMGCARTRVFASPMGCAFSMILLELWVLLL